MKQKLKYFRISNVASASMMLPIVIAVVKQIARLDQTFQCEQIPDIGLVNSAQDISSMAASRIGFDKSNLSIYYEDTKLISTPTSVVKNSDELPNTPQAKKLMKGLFPLFVKKKIFL